MTGHEPSPWMAADHARPLVTWSRVQLDAVARAFDRSYASWAVHWGIEATVQSEARIGSLVDGRADWMPLVQQADAAMWLLESPEFIEQLLQQLWGAPEPLPPIAAAVTRACREDLRKALSMAGTWSPAAPSEGRPPSPLPWSGMVIVALARGLQLLLDAGAVGALAPAGAAVAAPAAPPSRQPLLPVSAALAGHPLRLDVRLDACRLDIGGLRALRVGDVLRLQHRLDKPAGVHAAGGDLLFHGHLVHSRGRKAIELLSTE
jgi:flagellar motor switch/type III secretory pathway protein FliN